MVSLAMMVPCCIIALAASAYLPLSNWIGSHPVMHYKNVYVLASVDDWSYWLRTDDGTTVYVTFCKDLGFQPPFDFGETISVMNARNMGSCWSLKDMHPAYVMLRDSNGELIRKGD